MKSSTLIFRILCFASLAILGLAAAPRAGATAGHALIEKLLEEPTGADWKALERFDDTLTRTDFETRLDRVFDPGHGLKPYLRFEGDGVVIYSNPERQGYPLVRLRFAGATAERRGAPISFRSPAEFQRRIGPHETRLPLNGLRIAIEPADIGGRWAKMEDRTVLFPGYGRISEGDLNLVVGRLLATRLRDLGVTVFLVRDKAEPVLSIAPDRLLDDAEQLLTQQPWRVSDLFENRPNPAANGAARRLHVAAGLFVTKTLETRARAALIRESFTPDLTIVLQHNATPESSSGRLVPINRNIFFIGGAFQPAELQSPEQRLWLLTKLLEDTTPIEVQVATAIASRFKSVTGFPPVLYGNSINTRLVAPGDPYVVARNLAFNREHDGPVVVTEPYFMNQSETLVRLLAGDYPGRRFIAGKWQVSIFREYADCVAEGVLASYR